MFLLNNSKNRNIYIVVLLYSYKKKVINMDLEKLTQKESPRKDAINEAQKIKLLEDYEYKDSC